MTTIKCHTVINLCKNHTPSKKACFAVPAVWTESIWVAMGLFSVALKVPLRTESCTKGEN